MEVLLRELTYIVTITSAIVATVFYLWRSRKTSIDELRTAIARAWTNEGDILSNEHVFVTLTLALKNGDVYGTLRVSSQERLLEAHVDLAWGRAYLTVTRLMGRTLGPVGKVRLRLTGNRNRVKWKLLGRADGGILPAKTLLWPSITGKDA